MPIWVLILIAIAAFALISLALTFALLRMAGRTSRWEEERRRNVWLDEMRYVDDEALAKFHDSLQKLPPVTSEQDPDAENIVPIEPGRRRGHKRRHGRPIR